MQSTRRGGWGDVETGDVETNDIETGSVETGDVALAKDVMLAMENWRDGRVPAGEVDGLGAADLNLQSSELEQEEVVLIDR
jgi:hypothetical protein